MVQRLIFPLLLGALPSHNAGLLGSSSGGKPRPAPKCAETQADNGTIVNPLSWQLKYVNETETLRDVAARLATLDAARRRIMGSNSLRSQIPCNFGKVKNAFCDSVRTPAARAAHRHSHAKLSWPSTAQSSSTGTRAIVNNCTKTGAPPSLAGA